MSKRVAPIRHVLGRAHLNVIGSLYGSRYTFQLHALEVYRFRRYHACCSWVIRPANRHRAFVLFPLERPMNTHRVQTSLSYHQHLLRCCSSMPKILFHLLEKPLLAVELAHERKQNVMTTRQRPQAMTDTRAPLLTRYRWVLSFLYLSGASAAIEGSLCPMIMFCSPSTLPYSPLGFFFPL